MSRRRMLQLAGGSLIAAKLLAGCGDSMAGYAAADVRLGTPEEPVSQPLFDDNPPIESGLEPEAGPLKLYNWADYIYLRTVKDFEAEFGVDVELTTFYNMEEATRKLRTGDLSFDVFFPTAEVLPKFVAGELLQPLNHDYLPNLAKNVWPRLQDPYYDLGSLYTVPYTVYETGIGWRADLIEPELESMANPWEVFWDPQYEGTVGLYDDYRETLGIGLYKNGFNDINTDDLEALHEAQTALMELVDLVNIRYTIDGAYAGIPERKFAMHHAWSGDIVGSQYYFPNDDDPSVMRFMWPPKSQASTAGGYASNDSLAVLRNAEHPVLAHMFINYLLEEQVAIKNFSWLGYQPPLNGATADVLVSEGLVPENVTSAVVTEEDLTLGQIPVQLKPEVELRWLDTWSRVQSG
jgi:spermidine/putrescine transport system substrate-binding protein